MRNKNAYLLIELLRRVLNGDTLIATLSRRILQVSSITVLLVLVEELCNIELFFRFESIPLWDYTIRSFLDNNYIVVLFFWIIFSFAEKIIKCILLEQKSDDEPAIELFSTITDLIDLVCSVFCFVLAINYVIEHKKGYMDLDYFFSAMAILYLMYGLAARAFLENRSLFRRIRPEQACYYDVCNQAISHNSYVIYHQKKYHVKYAMDTLSRGKREKDWVMISCADKSYILLKDAIDDPEGKLTVIDRVDYDSAMIRIFTKGLNDKLV